MHTEIPDFDEHGCLPPGVYTVGIDDVVKRFGGAKSLKRSQLTKNLKLFYNFARYHAIEIYIDGSYVTQRLSPGDVDILVIFPLSFLENTAAHIRLSDFTKGHVIYKLHIFSCMSGIEEVRRTGFFHDFTHARKEDGGYEKGIIRLECNK